jgi:CHASE2 domain-containing sensor protein
MKYLFGLNTLLCTGYIGLFVFVFTHLPIQTDLFDPLAKAFEDFEMSDLVFSQPPANENLATDEVEYLRDPSEIAHDTNIVLVNIQFKNRAEISQMLDIINKYEPKIVGIDAFFRKEKGPALDFPLAMSLSQTRNLVLVNELVTTDETKDVFDSLQYSNPMFNETANNGFANVLSSASGEGFRTVKEFYPFQYLGNTDSLYPNFSTKIVELANPEAYEYLKSRGHFTETINWTGNYRKFTAFDAHQVLGEIGDLTVMKDKIVLMGYIGQSLGERDLVDIFYTPQNPRVAGRAYPDTYGVVVHANIISMIMDKKYIHQTPEWLTMLLLVVITYLNVALFLFIADRRKMYFDLITKSIQLLEIALFMGLIVMLMLKFQIKIHLTFVLVALSGDLTELYAGSLRPIAEKYLLKFGLIKSKSENNSNDQGVINKHKTCLALPRK